MKKTVFLLVALLATFVSCFEKGGDTKADENNSIDKCIHDLMSDFYLWNNTLPKFDQKEKRNPDEFFESLLHRDDFWSFISDDYKELSAELDGEPTTTGIAPLFWGYNNGNNVLIVVAYVYPNSPAAKAGIERGDIILLIDGKELTPENYYEEYTKKSASYTLATYDYTTEKLNETKTVDVTAQTLKCDPSVCDTIYEIEGKKIGYYAYMQYTEGVSNEYLKNMYAIFDKFKAEGVKDLILDLRYNSGGSVNAAQNLVSSIAPASCILNNSIIVSLVYNTLVGNALEEEDPENLYYRFINNGHNADMQNLYVLTTEGTASASELTIIGLEPYMNVVQIGENSHGKYTGMVIFDRTISGCEDLDNWAIAPIIFKYANSEGYTDFVNGLEPQIKVEDDVLSGYPLGCTDDPMINAAICDIFNIPLTMKSAVDIPFKSGIITHESATNNVYLKGKDLKK